MALPADAADGPDLSEAEGYGGEPMLRPGCRFGLCVGADRPVRPGSLTARLGCPCLSAPSSINASSMPKPPAMICAAGLSSAIEAVTAYERFLHGEAVAAGMVMAMDLSVRLGRSTDQDAERVRRLIERSGLATETLDVDVEAMLEAMGMDKQVMDGRLRLIVCDGIGAVSVASDVPEQTLRQAIALGR